jgi:hypothetical protein
MWNAAAFVLDDNLDGIVEAQATTGTAMPAGATGTAAARGIQAAPRRRRDLAGRWQRSDIDGRLVQVWEIV